jgi:hypothetical protein
VIIIKTASFIGQLYHLVQKTAFHIFNNNIARRLKPTAACIWLKLEKSNNANPLLLTFKQLKIWRVPIVLFILKK